MAMVVLSAAAGGVLLPSMYAANVQREAQYRTLAAKLASDKLEQILNTPYTNIYSTYNGTVENQGAVKNAVGIPFTAHIYSGFSRRVNCQTATVAGVDMLWITVTVAHSGNDMVRLSTLIGP